MTNTRNKGDSVSGRFSGQDRISQLKRNNSDFRKASYGSKYLPSFAKTKTIVTTPSEDSTNYLQIVAYCCNDPQYFANGLYEAITRFHKIGHYDEEVAAQKAAFLASAIAQYQTLSNLLPMHILHDLLSNPPTDEANATTLDDGTQANTIMALYDRDTLATILQDMENSKIEVLPIIIEIIKALYYVVHVRDEEKIGGVYSPGENIMFGMPKDAKATHDTNVAAIITNKGKFRKFCNFYGVKTEPFTASMVTDYDTRNSYLDPKVMESFKYQVMACRDGAATNLAYFSSTNFITATQMVRWKESTEEAVDQFMALKLAFTYNATNNLYGGLCLSMTGTVQDNVNIVEIYQDDASQGAANGFDPKTLTEDNVARLYSKFAAGHYPFSATFALAFTGTDLAADHIITEPSWLVDHGYVNYKITSQLILHNALVNWIADKLGLSAVKKGGK